MNNKPIRILLDDVFFSLANTGIARLWQETMSYGVKNEIFTKENLEFTILNRSGKLNHLGLKTIDFPQYDTWLPAVDRDLLSCIAVHNNFDIFVSTYFTCVPSMKNLMVMYDLIPEIFEFSRTSRGWLEREIGIYSADEVICISNSTKHDLKSFFAHFPENRIQVAHPGINHQVFYRRSSKVVSNFKYENDVKEYVVFTGSRYQTNGYKNADLFFSAVEKSEEFNFDVVCIGGEPLTRKEVESIENKGRRIVRLLISDEELAVCLSGATALLYPSLYEGFGIPPLECLAVGTPVITTMHSSLPESVGELSIVISGNNEFEILSAIKKASTEDFANFIRREGPTWASSFTWESMARALAQGVLNLDKLEWTSKDKMRHEFLANYTQEAIRFQGA